MSESVLQSIFHHSCINGNKFFETWGGSKMMVHLGVVGYIGGLDRFGVREFSCQEMGAD